MRSMIMGRHLTLSLYACFRLEDLESEGYPLAPSRVSQSGRKPGNACDRRSRYRLPPPWDKTELDDSERINNDRKATF